jgi:phospholipid/cholesterol/gamma-HCH transport system substrate-binding protein
MSPRFRHLFKAAAAGRQEAFMAHDRKFVLTGVFVVVLSAGFIWGILWISAGGTPQRVDRYVVYMLESVSGLNVDSSLKYRGVDVGKVEDIAIDAEDPERIRLLLQIRADIPITVDTVATLEYQGLTGLANVNLKGGGVGSAPLRAGPLEDYPVIKTEPSLFSRLDTTTSDLLANLISASERLSALLDDQNRDNISTTLQNFAILSKAFAEQSTRLESAVLNFNQLLTNAQAASTGMPGLVEKLSAGADAIAGMADEVRKVAERASIVSSDLERLVEHAGSDIDNLSSTTAPAIAGMVEDLRTAAQNLNRMTEVLANDPSVLVYGSQRIEPGPGEQRE